MDVFFLCFTHFPQFKVFQMTVICFLGTFLSCFSLVGKT